MSKCNLTAMIAFMTAAILATWSTANATVYNFTFNSPSESIIGQLTVDMSDNEVTNIAGTLSGLVNDTINGFIANPSFPNAVALPGDAFIYDNMFYPGRTRLWTSLASCSPPLGTQAVTGTSGAARPATIRSTSSNLAGGYPIAISGGNLDPAAVPEPSTWVMMLVGLAAVGSAAYRRGRKDRLAPMSI